MELGETPNMPFPQCGKSIKNLVSNNNDAPIIMYVSCIIIGRAHRLRLADVGLDTLLKARFSRVHVAGIANIATQSQVLQGCMQVNAATLGLQAVGLGGLVLSCAILASRAPNHTIDGLGRDA